MLITVFKKICLAIGLMYCLPTSGQQATSYKLEEENKKLRILTLFVDRQGYLFAGSTTGLYKFDGSRFYKIHFKNKEYDDTVTAVFQDREKIMWAGFKSGRVARLVNNQLTFINWEEGSPAQRITSFLQDPKGQIWIATAGEGVYYIKNKRLYLVNKENGMTDGNVSGLSQAKNGDILTATDQGINIIHVNEQNKVTGFGIHQGLPDYLVTSVISLGNDKFGIGMQEKGYCIYDYKSGKIQPCQEWEYGSTSGLLADGQNMWITTPGYLLKTGAGGMDKPEVVYQGNDIRGPVQDHQGNTWIADGNELHRFPVQVIKKFSLPPGVVFEHVHTLLPDKDGNLWLTNYFNELLRQPLSSNSGSVKKIHLAGINEKTDITYLHQDKDGNIWIGSMGKGIFLLNPKNGQYREFDENPVFKNSSILSISGAGNRVFISSLQGAMVVETGAGEDINRKYRYSDYGFPGMSLHYIYAIYQDTKNRTWFATDGSGIYKLENGKYSGFDKELSDDRVYSITEDKKGNIWFSTAHAGIYKYDGHFQHYGYAQGLSDLNISAIKTDSKGNVVIIHKSGLDILDPVSNTIAYIGPELGVQNLNVEDLGAVAQNSEGNIFMSAPGHVIQYTPRHIISQQPKTLLESVQLFLNPIDTAESHVFANDENNFTFNYTGLYYSDPDRVLYQYKLEGFDTSWITTRDRSKNFPKLAPGKYTFRLRASLNRNFINADEASYSFRVKQAFYKEWWFIITLAFLAAGLLFWYIKNREARLGKLQKLQEEKIRFQFEVLRNQVNPHFLFNSFNTLISTIEEDPEMAVEYVEHLSGFFRNVVTYREVDVISLEEELGLLETYYFLQKKRFKENIQLMVDTGTWGSSTYVPPLTLQLLAENAIKHNATVRENPLLIQIMVEDNYLVVRNNLIPKISPERGAGMGLQNIINRYRLLTSQDVKVQNTGGYFTVSLPLLKNEHA